MNDYAATFHTHLSALLTCRALTNAGIPARMAPVTTWSIVMRSSPTSSQAP